jgi:hypothetical protein
MVHAINAPKDAKNVIVQKIVSNVNLDLCPLFFQMENQFVQDVVMIAKLVIKALA